MHSDFSLNRVVIILFEESLSLLFFVFSYYETDIMPLCTFVFFNANQYYLPRLKANINRVECPARSIISNDCNRAREELFRQTEPNGIQDSCLEPAVPVSLRNIVLVGCIRLFFHQ